MKRIVGIVLFALVTGWASLAAAQDTTFNAGALIIPMDTTYQDDGMLVAYGLVYELLRNDVPVSWVIEPAKSFQGTDFTASATDYSSGATINQHAYSGGPWVIAAGDAAAAGPIIDSWQQSHDDLPVVHVASGSFSGHVTRKLVVAPSIAMFADGKQDIARDYVQAAGIPDSTLDYAWPDSSPDMLDPTEVSGPTTTAHNDGELFDANGNPKYCQLMSMHWDVRDAEDNPEVVAEVRRYLNFPTHFFAECQAVNAFENSVHGHFLTPNGFEIGDEPNSVDMYNADSPYAQMSGTFETTGGSEPAYTLPQGDTYLSGGIVMITEAGTPEGVNDIWMTGYLDGLCPPDAPFCERNGASLGKISYLGGHSYDTKLPISQEGKTQGTRLFLNSLFEAQCATEAGQPHLDLSKQAPAETVSSQVTYTIDYVNYGPGVARAAIIRDTLPSGATFVSASNGGQLDGNTVEWELLSLGPGASGSVTVTVELGDFGTHDNEARLDYQVGLNNLTKASNTASTQFMEDTDDDGVGDPVDNCPQTANADQADLDGDGDGDACDDDIDGDGLSNDEEAAIGTDPSSSDTDGDGISDGDEVGGDLQSPPDTDGDGVIDALDDDTWPGADAGSGGDAGADAAMGSDAGSGADAGASADGGAGLDGGSGGDGGQADGDAAGGHGGTLGGSNEPGCGCVTVSSPARDLGAGGYGALVVLLLGGGLAYRRRR